MSEEAFTPPPSEETVKSEVTFDTFEDLYEGEYAFGRGVWYPEEESLLYGEEQEYEEETFFDTNDYVSTPYSSKNCTLPKSIIQFDSSFGYDCQRYFNLCVMENNILIFASGNLIHFFNTITGEKWYRSSYSDGGIGHITKNPTEPHFAVGEKGNNPLIFIYEWPTLEIVSILKNGTKLSYSFLDYSPDGELLGSQGGHPDYLLSIWNWRKNRIMLRAKAYTGSVFSSRFSLFVNGHLTSSGLNHIKFWKVNNTFTGLKLQGELGRFGKSEICNVIGFLSLPDEKVVSGCQWGNILVWEAGLIRVEVCRRGKTSCHESPITQFIYNNGDLISVALDGTIKVWYYETIELADPPEEDKLIEVEPIYEYEVGDYYHKAKLLSIVEGNSEELIDHIWFGQDANGGIWKLDLSMTSSAAPPVQIFHSHAGKVVAIQASPFSPHIASLGEDGRLYIYDYLKKLLILRKEFIPGGCSLLWAPLIVEESGCLLIGGFKDGVIRIMCVSLHEYMSNIPSPTEEYINIIQVSKPHTKPVNCMITSPHGSTLVTGSDDCTIFVYIIKRGKRYPELMPIGFIDVSGEVTSLSWNPNKDDCLLVTCRNGTFMEVDIPTDRSFFHHNTYQLRDGPVIYRKFVSIKGEVLRKLKIQELEAEALLRRQNAESGTSLITDSEGGSAEEMGAGIGRRDFVVPDAYVPKTPSPILFGFYRGEAIVLFMGSFDAGYVYEYSMENEYPVRFLEVPDAVDLEITAHHYYHNNKYLILGMNDGKIRIVRVKRDPLDFSGYISYPMHDKDKGTIRQICFSYNYAYMFTCGDDGNVFSYVFSPENDNIKYVDVDSVMSKGFPSEVVADIDDAEALSLEQEKKKIENDGKTARLIIFKRELTDVLKGLEKKFDLLTRRNQKLPKSQQLTPEELILDERITEDLHEQLRCEMNLVKSKLAWHVEKWVIQYNKLDKYYMKPVENLMFRVQGIQNKDIFVESFRSVVLEDSFNDLKNLVAIKLEEQEAKGRAQTRLYSEEEIVETVKRRPNPVEALLKQIMALCGDYQKNIKLRRLLRKYRDRKENLESRRIEWYEMMRKKPDPQKPDSEDVNLIENAKENIGDYQLKTSPNYRVPKNAKVTTVHVYDQLLKTREKVYLTKKKYNDAILNLRETKQKMIERHEILRDNLLEIAKEIPKEKIRNPPNLPSFIEDIEFPEKKLLFDCDDLSKTPKTVQKIETPRKREVKHLDMEYEMLLLDRKTVRTEKVHSKLPLMKFLGITGLRDLPELEEAARDDAVNTPWEKELRKLRVVQRLYEQDEIIAEMENAIKKFDEDIIKFYEMKYKTEVDLRFLEIYRLTLYQEVLILKKFESEEEQKENKLFDKIKEKHNLQKKMNEINSKVEGRNREIRRCEEEIKNLVTTFHATVAENKFYDFLKRIFKKKYRPPKIKSEDSDSESESESSSSSEEEDTKSIDSKEIGPLRLDETACPPGCDPQLYEWTFTQRAARHGLELTISEEKKQIEVLKKEHDSNVKSTRNVEAQYLVCKEDLEEYMREKQRNLNEVETVVILHVSQIQNFVNESELEKVSESIVFSSPALSLLYKRVGELEKETQVEKQKHLKNRQHLSRMQVDINYMKKLINQLNMDIEEGMIKKFGTKIDIDDIEETLLKRLVAEMHSIVKELEKDFQKKLSTYKKQILEKEDEYARKLQSNTERYNLLSVLQEERTKIQETIERQDKIMCAETNKDDDQEKDLEGLRKVIKMQETKINELRSDIEILKSKSKRKPNINTPEFPEVLQRYLIKTEDGDYEEICEEDGNQLRDMYEEAREIAQDLKAGFLTQEDKERMQQLTSDMIIRLPPKCRDSLVKCLAKSMFPKERIALVHTDNILKEILQTLKDEAFLQALDRIRDNIESMIPEIYATEHDIQQESEQYFETKSK